MKSPALCVFLLAGLLACRVSLSPVKNRINIGVESYVVFDAEGEEGKGDLFAVPASGGKVFQLTFSRVHESAPMLSPNGIMLAFIRGPRPEDTTGRRVWVLNLLNGAEREIPPVPDAYPERVAWAADGSALYIRTRRGDFRAAAPPAESRVAPIELEGRATADTALSVPLGDPVAGIAQPCDSGGGLCVFTRGGSQLLAATGRDPFRWGSDSVGYLSAEGLQVRPLGGGSTRALRWSGVPPGVRTATYFPGLTATAER